MTQNLTRTQTAITVPQRNGDTLHASMLHQFVSARVESSISLGLTRGGRLDHHPEYHRREMARESFRGKHCAECANFNHSIPCFTIERNRKRASNKRGLWNLWTFSDRINQQPFADRQMAALLYDFVIEL